MALAVCLLPADIKKGADHSCWGLKLRPLKLAFRSGAEAAWFLRVRNLEWARAIGTNRLGPGSFSWL